MGWCQPRGSGPGRPVRCRQLSSTPTGDQRHAPRCPRLHALGAPAAAQRSQQLHDWVAADGWEGGAPSGNAAPGRQAAPRARRARRRQLGSRASGQILPNPGAAPGHTSSCTDLWGLSTIGSRYSQVNTASGKLGDGRIPAARLCRQRALQGKGRARTALRAWQSGAICRTQELSISSIPSSAQELQVTAGRPVRHACGWPLARAATRAHNDCWWESPASDPSIPTVGACLSACNANAFRLQGTRLCAGRPAPGAPGPPGDRQQGARAFRGADAARAGRWRHDGAT